MPFLVSESAVLTAAYLDDSQLFSPVFRSHKGKALAPSTTLLSSASLNASFFESQAWDDPLFAALQSGTPLTPVASSASSSSVLHSTLPSSLGTLLSLSVDISRLALANAFPACHQNTTQSSSHCYVSLVALPLEQCQGSNSWTCDAALFREEAKIFKPKGVAESTHLDHGFTGEPPASPDPLARDFEETTSSNQCVRVMGGPVLTDEDVSAFKFSFCGNPLRHLVAVDGIHSRIFVVQHLPPSPLDADRSFTGSSNSTSTSSSNSSITTPSSSSISSTNHDNDSFMNSTSPSPYCISTIHLDSYYADVSECVPLSLPVNLQVGVPKQPSRPDRIQFDASRPPVYMHYDSPNENLILFNFDSTGSIVVTAMGTTVSMPPRFSIRLENLSSGWLLASDDMTRSSLLLLGDKLPYLGVLHVIDLENAKDTRLDVEKELWNFLEEEGERQMEEENRKGRLRRRKRKI